MNIFQIASLKVFQTFCICLVGYLTYQQFLEYVKNQDSSSVSYRSFNEEEKDVYPTFSICLYSKDGSILKDDMNYFGIKGKDGVANYHNMLLGLNDVTEDFMTINFDKSVIDIPDTFVDISVSHTRQGDTIDNKNLFYKSYQDPYFSCITKSSIFIRNQLFDYDYVILNSSNILTYMEDLLKNDNSMNMYVYIHHPGQLIEEFGKQVLELQREDFKKAIEGSFRSKNNYRDVHLSHVEILRKRSDGYIPCNKNLETEDGLWLEKVTKHVNCVPIYWRGLISQMHLKNSHLPICNSSDKYNYIHYNFLPPNNFENGSRLYEGQASCNQMQIMLSVSTKESPISSDDQRLILGFQHARAKYRETINIKKFGHYHLWSEVGGFIGIFLGFGLMQVPGLVQDLIEGFQGYCLGHRRKFRKVRSKSHRILPAKLQLPKSFDKAPISKSVLLYPNKDAMDIPRYCPRCEPRNIRKQLIPPPHQICNLEDPWIPRSLSRESIPEVLM